MAEGGGPDGRAGPGPAEGTQKRFDWNIKSIFSTGKSLPVEGCAVQLCLVPRWRGGDVNAGSLRSSPLPLPGCVIVFKSLALLRIFCMK
ncbi:hypothetical protein QTO34_002822 [Cnephaeus nilssonii]|uniref:Uncharacterized protein n=1 Tax=Cnephaeus nilssonii TaxID=3371016 RepID=A0AA40HT53_CNENI|nr:hypothetical protein QTO34_002822 [Eptesicus nilssonii]